MNTKRENIRDGRPIVFMFSFMTDKTKLILGLMTDGLKSKLFRTTHPTYHPTCLYSVATVQIVQKI